MSTQPPPWPPTDGTPSAPGTPPPYQPPAGPPPFQAPGQQAPYEQPGFQQPSYQQPQQPPYGQAPYSQPGYGQQPPYGQAPYQHPPVAPPPPAPPRSRRRSRVLVSVGSIVTVGLVGLGAAAIAFGGGGASSPEEAVQQLAVAIDGEDVLAAVATLAPDETRSLPDLYDQSMQKARALDDDESNDDGDDPRDLWEGLDLRVEGLELETTELADDLAKVEITGGTISYEVEKGSTARDRFDEFYDSLLPFANEDAYYECEDAGSDDDYEDCVAESADDATSGEFDFDDDVDRDDPPVFVMAVERDGGWYLSPLFTIAEYMRIAFDSPEPDSYTVDAGPASSSPTEAVEALADSIEATDVDAIVDTLSSELNVWRIYGDTVDDAGFDEDVDSIEIDDLELSEEPIDDERVRVVIEKAHIVAVVEEYEYVYDEEDEFGDDSEGEDRLVPVTYDIRIDGDCITTSDDSEFGEEETWCAGDDGGEAEALGFDRLSLVAVTDRDGWAVSPIETFADYLRTFVDKVDQPLIDRIGMDMSGGEIDREPSMTLSEGENDVPLDSAGVAVVEVVVDDGALATVSSPDDDVEVEIPYEEISGILGAGTHKVVVKGPIGADSVVVELSTVEVTPLPTIGADGGVPEPITGEVPLGKAVAYSTTARDYRVLSVDVGYNIYQDTLDEDGAWTYVDEDTDDDQVITLVLTNEDYGDNSDPTPEDDQYTIRFYPPGGGFASADPANTSVMVDDEGYYPSTGLAVLNGAAVDVTATSPVDATVELYCGYTNPDGTAYDPDTWDDEYDPTEETPPFLTLTAGVPATARLTPGATEVCSLDVYPDDYSNLPTGPLTLSVTPAGP